jgi:GntR family transcriptional repressor for pyruvate dehydrogenase complex
MPFKEIETTSIAHKVIRQIIGAIQNGDYSVGDRLPPERKLAEMLGISRPTVREAMSALAILGVLEIQQGSGTYVRATAIDENLATKAAELLSTPESPLYALEFRMLMEPGIAALAAERAEESDLKNMQTALDGIARRVAQNKPFRASGKNFHLAIVRSIKNPVVEHTCIIALAIWFGEVPEWVDVVDAVLQVPGRLEKYYQNSIRIFQAIRERDAERASEETRKHLVQLQEDFLRY